MDKSLIKAINPQCLLVKSDKDALPAHMGHDVLVYSHWYTVAPSGLYKNSLE